MSASNEFEFIDLSKNAVIFQAICGSSTFFLHIIMFYTAHYECKRLFNKSFLQFVHMRSTRSIIAAVLIWISNTCLNFISGFLNNNAIIPTAVRATEPVGGPMNVINNPQQQPPQHQEMKIWKKPIYHECVSKRVFRSGQPILSMGRKILSGIVPTYASNGACVAYNYYASWARHFQPCLIPGKSHQLTHFCQDCEMFGHPKVHCPLSRACLKKCALANNWRTCRYDNDEKCEVFQHIERSRGQKNRNKKKTKQ